MYTMSLYPFGKLNFKVATLVPMLLLSMFTMVPIVTSQITPNIAKISPTLLNEMANAGESVNVLIKTFTNDYSSVVRQINELGGKVEYLFKYVSGLSASVPASNLVELSRNSLIQRIYYDAERSLASVPGASLLGPKGGDDLDQLLAVPTVADIADWETISVTPAELAGSEPSNYWNTKAMGAEEIWAETNYGEGSLVVIIDTGIWTGHFMFRGTDIIGGVDLSYDVGDPTYEGWDNPNNHFHGSHVAGTIASTGGVIAHPGTSLYIYAQALESYSGITLPTYPDGRKIIWLLGMAPAASLYIVKVFDHTGGGIPESMVIAGMEHALDLKLTQGVDVDIISMSLGGPTLFDGRDIEDLLVDIITANGITLVAAAGNEGPASMTVTSPGSAYTAITAGAAADPVHTKAFWDYYYGMLGIGPYFFTSLTPQIIYFSSRGPTSDGRLKPTLSGTGVFVLSAYPTGGIQAIAWASGTSMSTPAISGATALLNAYAEMYALPATPEDYKQALTGGAVWLEGYNEYDQGAGYLNAKDALDSLKADPSYGDAAPPLPPHGWLADIRNIPIVKAGVYTASVEDLEPGHKVEYIFYVSHLTDSIRLDLTDVHLGIENPLGLNSFEVYIQSAKRTMYAYHIDSANVWGDASFLVTDYETTWTGEVTGVYWDDYTRLAPIEPGYVKIVIENDWTSYDALSVDITITVTVTTKILRPCARVIRIGMIGQDEATPWMRIKIPKGTQKAIVQLTWLFDWSMYPTTDLDLYVYWDEGYNYNGATLNSPERVILEKPTYLYVLIHGYAIYTGFKEPYVLTIWFIK